MPMLGSVRTAMPSSENGSSSATLSCLATSSAATWPATRGSRTANSSPPSRATVSAAPQRLAQPDPHLSDQMVADLVAERVVHLLESIEIQQQYRRMTALAARGEQRLSDAVLQKQSIWQTRERIVGGLVPVLLGLGAQSARGARDDPHEHGPQQQQPAHEQKHEAASLACDPRRDRRIRHVQLKLTGWRSNARGSERNVDLEQTAEAAIVCVLSLVERRDLRCDPAHKRGRELIRHGEALAHEIGRAHV